MLRPPHHRLSFVAHPFVFRLSLPRSLCNWHGRQDQHGSFNIPHFQNIVPNTPPSSSILQHRLRKELRIISREPPPHITARPLPSNILKWYFVLEGPNGTPYEGGIFMGRLQFPEQYPYKPPGIFLHNLFLSYSLLRILTPRLPSCVHVHSAGSLQVQPKALSINV